MIDIDGTILYSKVNDNGSYIVTGINHEIVTVINRMYDDGHSIVLWTARHWNHLIDTKNQIDEIGIKYHSLNMGKPYADIYVDDRSMRPEEFIEMEF